MLLQKQQSTVSVRQQSGADTMDSDLNMISGVFLLWYVKGLI